MKSIGFFNRKGGVGKTSLSVLIAHTLAIEDKKVVIVDCDTQGNASSQLLKTSEYEKMEGFEKDKIFNLIKYELADFLEGKCYIDEVIKKTGRHNLSILPTRPAQFSNLVKYSETELITKYHVFNDLKEELSNMGFDYAIFDMSPSRGMLERRIIKDLDEIISVMEAEFFSVEGLGDFSAFINEIRKDDRSSVIWNKILINKLDATIKHHKEHISAIGTLGEIKQYYIKKDVRIPKSQNEYKTLYEILRENEDIAKDRNIPQLSILTNDLIAEGA